MSTSTTYTLSYIILLSYFILTFVSFYTHSLHPKFAVFFYWEIESNWRLERRFANDRSARKTRREGGNLRKKARGKPLRSQHCQCNSAMNKKQINMTVFISIIFCSCCSLYLCRIVFHFHIQLQFSGKIIKLFCKIYLLNI